MKLEAIHKLSGIICIAAIIAAADVASAEDLGSEFVSTQGMHFIWRDAPFYYAGTNCYYLGYFSADPVRRASIDDLLDLYVQRGMKVIRVWAFNDGGSNVDGYTNEWAYQQTPTSIYNETALQGLDYCVAEAAKRDIKILLAFTNQWDDYGGMNWYVNASPTAFSHDDFYIDPTCKDWYKARMEFIVNRRNTFNDVLYKNDPTIFAWELANEPWCTSDPRCQYGTFRAWVSEMSTYLRGLDPNHMITIGVVGFYNRDHAGEWPAGHTWLYDGYAGTDFIRDHQLPNISFCTVHLYPDHWNMADKIPAITQFLQHHIDDCTSVIHKPLIMEEFGKREPNREAVLETWMQTVYASALAGGAAAGWNYWMIEAEGSGHDDTFSLLPSDPSDAPALNLLTAEAVKMNALTAPPQDINADGIVDILDLLRVRNNLNRTPGSDGYIRADCNRDGRINILDLINVRNALRLTWP